MGHHTTSMCIGLENLPPAVRSLSTLTDADYADLCTVTTADGEARSPEQWARAVLEATSAGRRARVLWRSLGLRLGPVGSPNHVQGWAIAARGDDWIRLETGSWYATAQCVFHVDDGRLSLALFFRYDRPVAALIWPPVSVLHQRGVPGLLLQALKLLRQPQPTATASC